ncbi:MAG: DUF6531 domain-containing protein [Candidatus Gracilibacteria bacterium]|nr:DUF6531 domain-containing protein [Candidatus Gracilibacteria bacterium]
MGNINNINLLTKISLKIVIFLMGFWSFLFTTSAYNDACGEQLQSAFNTNLAKEVHVEKTFSLSGLNSDNINTILTGYNGLEYIGISGNNIFFIHDNKLKKAVYQNGIIQDGNLFDFNDTINSKNDILTIQNNFIYYKNTQDNDSIYKLNIYCNDTTLKGAKISNPIPNILMNYTYVFNDNSAIYYKDIFGKLYKIKNWYYGNDIEQNNLVDTGIFIDSFLFYDTNEYYFYYTFNGKTYKLYAGYYNITTPIKTHDLAINTYIFHDNSNIYYYDDINDITKYTRKDGSSVIDDIFFHGKIEKYITKYNNLNYFTYDFYNDGFPEVYRMFNSNSFEQLTDLSGVIPLFVDNNLLIYGLKQYNEVGLIDELYSLKLDGKVNYPPSSSSSSGGGTITNPVGETSQTNTNQTINSDLINQKILDHYKTKAIREKEAIKSSHEGDPVMLYSGEFIYENTLLNYPGVGLPFSFDITYKNQSRYSGPIGNNFDFSYNQYLTEEENGDVKYYDGKLGVVLFEYDEENEEFKYNTSTKSQLFFDGEFYRIVKNNTLTYYFNLDLKLDGIEDNFFNFIFIEHDDTEKIEKIIDTLGNEYLFSYRSDTRLEKIIDFNQNEVIFDYYNTDDELGGLYDLKSITIKNGNEEKTTSFEYTKGDDFDSSHNITKLIDFAGNVYVENTYDYFDRVNVQKFGEGDITYNYTLSDDESYILKNEVITRVGDKFIYTYNPGGQILSKEIFKKSGESYEYTYEYDSNNNLIKETNPLGNGFAYSYDSNNNLIERRQKADTSLENSTNDIVVSFEYDDVFNKKTKEILPNGTIINYTLDDFGNVLQKETIAGNIKINEFFEYNELGQLVSKTDGNGNIVNFEYTNGNLSKIIKNGTNENIETNFEYDSKGNITKITDGEGNITNLSYDNFNLLVSQTTPSGIETNFEYNSLNKKTKETIILNDTTDKITSFEYDILDNPTKVTTNIDGEKNKTIVTKYDNDNRIIEAQNGSNAKNTFLYDENGNITKKSTILNNNTEIITSYVYDLNDRLIKQINPNGSEINFEYDLFDRLIKATNSDNSYITNTYDNMGNLLETRSYDSSDNLVSKTSFEYDKLSRKTKQINYLLEENKQIITRFVYDNNSNILSQTNALNQTTSFVYDSFNRLIKTTDNLGNIVEYKYNKNDKITEEILTGTNGKILKKEYYYDSDGRLETFHDDNGKINSYSYNKLGQLISYNDGNSITSYTYDLLGNKLSESVPHPNPLPEGEGIATTNYEYDENSNMIKLIDANGNETNYEYDELNRLIKQTYADNSYISYTYDINSNVSKKIDGNGTIINYIYDSQNRLIEKNIINGENVIGITKENFEYDSLGRLTKTTNNEGSETLFSYDSLNRLISETQSPHPNPLPEGEGIKTINYTYDSLGNKTSISIDGKTTSYKYDSNSRLETISRENQEIVRYNYDSLNLLSQTYGNGQITTYGYDENYNRLTNLNTLNKNFTYEYTSNNLIQSNGYENYTYDEKNQLIQVQFNTRFVNKDFIDYSYDAMGNRLNEMYGRINKKGNINYFKDFEYTTNNLNQYTNKSFSVQDSEGQATNEEDSFFAESYEGLVEDIESLNTTESEPLVELNGKLIYDKNGNMIGNMLNNKRQYIYSYDYKNRLVKVEKTIYKKVEGSETNEIEEITKIIQYRYDNLDRRIQKIYNNGSYTNYYYSNKDIILEKNYTKPNTNGLSKLKTSKYYTNGNQIDDILAMEKVDYKTRKVQEEYINKKGQTKTRNITENYTETNTYYYHKNHLNSIVAITDNLGNILEEYEYDVFGKPYSKDLLTGKVTNLKQSSIGNTRLFTGREYERGLQLYYNRARYYNPELGRFISRDPIDISDDVNLYSYVGNSVVSYSDVLGFAKQFGINFVREYDKFLKLEDEYNIINNKFNRALINPLDYKTSELLRPLRNQAYFELIAQEEITKELHYSRNKYNVDAGDNISLVNGNKWGELPLYLSWYHQQTASIIQPNRKFISNDGHYETIYEYNGSIENDIRDIGTYNIFDPVIDADNHIKYDIDPYYKWGNGSADDTNWINRHTGF